jgi:hypothetical protein
MSSAVATFPDVTLFDGRILAPGAARRLLGGAMVGLGTVAAACVLAAAAMASAAWIIGMALSTNPGFHAKRSIGIATIGVPNQRLALAGTANLSDSVHLADRDHRLHWARETELARAAIPAPAPIDVVPLPAKRPAEVANDVPPPHPLAPARKPTPTAADAPDLNRVAELTPAALPAPAAPAPLKPVADDVPLPPQRPPATPHMDAKNEIAPSPVDPVAPQVALVAPPPPAQTPPPPAQDKSPSPIEANNRTAVYDISAHTVYLPNGEKLEAHSGLGYRRDDPRYVDQKNRGPTPPNVYDLALRDGRFHGVRAIRLNPVDDGKMFGRDGMLAHTYMLGSTGQSYGCVSFKDYPAFLRAYLNGEVERLVVVPHLDGPPARVARAANASRYALNDE